MINSQSHKQKCKQMSFNTLNPKIIFKNKINIITKQDYAGIILKAIVNVNRIVISHTAIKKFWKIRFFKRSLFNKNNDN